MYKHFHGNDKLILNEKNSAVLERLINEADHLCISGVGEPLQAADVIKQIINLEFKNKPVELITSGNMSWRLLGRLLDELDERMFELENDFNLRISLDHWHYDAITNKNYSHIINYFLKKNLDRMTLSFRSVIQDKSNIHAILHDIFYNTDFKWEYCEINKLNSILYVNEYAINILFKPQVNQGETQTKQLFGGFINHYENIYQHDFKLVNNGSTNKQGISITIKPNSAIELYGLAGLVEWNINDDALTLDIIKKDILSNPILSVFFNLPFKHIINYLCQSDKMHKMIAKQNSPYWVIRELFEMYPKELTSSLKQLAAN
jgi:hypothetical protein